MRPSALHVLVETNDLEGVRALLSQQDDPKRFVNQLDGLGYAALFYGLVAKYPNPAVVEALLEAGAELTYVFNSRPTSEPGEPKPILPIAINQGHLDILELLRIYGADFHYVDESGYNAAIRAAYALRLPRQRYLQLFEYLISLGVDMAQVSSGGETALKTSYRWGRFELLPALFEAGADEQSLQWTPLIRAAAFGSQGDIEHELSQPHDLAAKDVWGRTALHVAIHRGDIALVDLLLERGAKLEDPGENDAPSLSYAILSGNTNLAEKLIDLGCPIEGRDDSGRSALHTAIGWDDLAMARTLLKQGANPNAPSHYSNAFKVARSAEMITLLLDHGADPINLMQQGRRTLLGLGSASDLRVLYEDITHKQYRAGRSPKEGLTNPQENNDAYWLAMIRGGYNTYYARKAFSDWDDFTCYKERNKSNLVWCNDRYGQSLTKLQDGRKIAIGGEYEQSFVPDFFIYNDVFLFEPDGNIRIFIYPDSVFPPTDFHTATLVDSFIYIIGGLGYSQQRKGEIPIYRLSIEDFHIEKVVTIGQIPNRIYSHRANLIDSNIVRISGGKEITFDGEDEKHIANGGIYQLNLRNLTWTKESAPQP